MWGLRLAWTILNGLGLSITPMLTTLGGQIQYLVRHEFIKRLHARFTQEGIVIPFPIRTVVQRDGHPEPQ